MAIPDFQTMMLPLLRLVAKKGPLRLSEAIEALSAEFRLTEDERATLLPSGKQKVFYNRAGWAKTYLKKAGLIDVPAPGVMVITATGESVLATSPERITIQFLDQFPGVKAFRTPKNVATPVASQSTAEKMGQTPEELFEESYEELKEELIDQLLEKVMSCSPSFFEHLVVQTLVTMGYGGSLAEAGKAIGRSGDEGIDGIISEDRLGLDMIYLQAKRWEGNVGRPEVQKFAGALQGKRARKGIFITTSDFTSESREYVKVIDAKIVLLSGRQFGELMLEHGVGVTTTATYSLKKIDSDFFIDEETDAAP